MVLDLFLGPFWTAEPAHLNGVLFLFLAAEVQYRGALEENLGPGGKQELFYLQGADRNPEPERRRFTFFKVRDLQRRMIGHERVNFHDLNHLWVGGENGGFYGRAAHVGETAI